MTPTRSSTLYGVEFEEWLSIRDERDRMAIALKRITASDRRTKSETLRRWAASAVYPDMQYPLARLLCKPTRYVGRKKAASS
jgi:hypothetical protein